MSKYYLVASYYNLRTKEYENETIIKSLQQNKLDTLSKIDEFTTNHTISEILNLIEKEHGKTGFNHLAIIYLKNKNSKPYHFRIIENDQRFNKSIVTCNTEDNYILNKRRKTTYLNRSNELYLEQVNILIKILENKDFEKFKNIYPYDPQENDFSYLVKRYIASSYDTEEARVNDLNLILLEFSRYKTFRGWYSNQIKLKNNIRIRNQNGIEQRRFSNQPRVIIHTKEENMSFFESRFKEKTGKSYDEYTTEQYNLENEEYLTEEEYTSMNDKTTEDNQPIIRRRH